jgi:predicted transcriptional regulator
VSEIIVKAGINVDPERIEPDLKYLILNEYISEIEYQGSKRTNIYIITPSGIDFCESLQRSDLTKIMKYTNLKMKKIAKFLLKELRE